jgi:hypothetical protein
MIARSSRGPLSRSILLVENELRGTMTLRTGVWTVPIEDTTTAPRRLWRATSAAPLLLLVVIYALWTDLVVLDGEGFRVVWNPGDFLEWVTMSVGTALLVAALWAPLRPIRMLAMAIYSLALSFGFGAAGVVAIVHAFGGPRGDLTAPTWALVALGLTSTLCALALLALGALLVDDIRAADAADAGRP